MQVFWEKRRESVTDESAQRNAATDPAGMTQEGAGIRVASCMQGLSATQWKPTHMAFSTCQHRDTKCGSRAQPAAVAARVASCCAWSVSSPRRNQKLLTVSAAGVVL